MNEASNNFGSVGLVNGKKQKQEFEGADFDVELVDVTPLPVVICM
jgi:hypothetical protein